MLERRRCEHIRQRHVWKVKFDLINLEEAYLIEEVEKSSQRLELPA